MSSKDKFKIALLKKFQNLKNTKTGVCFLLFGLIFTLVIIISNKSVSAVTIEGTEFDCETIPYVCTITEFNTVFGAQDDIQTVLDYANTLALSTTPVKFWTLQLDAQEYQLNSNINLPNYVNINGKGNDETNGTRLSMIAGGARMFYINNLTNPGKISNLVIQGSSNNSMDGGAMYISNSNGLSIKNVLFKNNISNNGGAIYISESEVDFQDVDFYENESQNLGGAIYITGGEIDFQNINFYQNESSSSGGAVYITTSGTHNFTNVNFENNVSQSSGGALYTGGSTVNISNSKFDNNTTPINLDTKGGAIYNHISTLTVNDSLFKNNISREGGAIYNYKGTLNLTNILFKENSSSSFDSSGKGGSIYNTSTPTQINAKNIIFDSNLSSGQGSVFYNDSPSPNINFTNITFNNNNSSTIYNNNNSSTINLRNIIFKNNNDIFSGYLPNINLHYYLTDTSVDHSSITQSNNSLGGTTLFNALSWGNVFVDSANNNFYIKSTDPNARNKGDNNSFYNDPDSSRNDLGAFGGPDAKTRSWWNTTHPVPYWANRNMIGTIITNTQAGDTILFPYGTFDIDSVMTFTTRRKIQGQGKENTILNGVTNNNRIIYINSVPTTTSDRFLIKDLAIENAKYTTSYGAGLYIINTEYVDIENVKFKNNTVSTSSKYGGAIYNRSSVSNTYNLDIKNSIFEENTATTGGGAIFNYSTLGTLNINLYSSIFDGNISNRGGAIYNLYTNGFINVNGENNTFVNNNASNTTTRGDVVYHSPTANINTSLINTIAINNGGSGEDFNCNVKDYCNISLDYAFVDDTTSHGTRSNHTTYSGDGNDIFLDIYNKDYQLRENLIDIIDRGTGTDSDDSTFADLGAYGGTYTNRTIIPNYCDTINHICYVKPNDDADMINHIIDRAAALANSSQNYTVKFPSGVFDIDSPIQLKNYVNLEGENMYNTILDGDNTSNILEMIGSRNNSISHFTIKNGITTTNDRAGAITIENTSASTINISNVIFTSNHILSNLFTTTSAVIKTNSSLNIDNVLFAKNKGTTHGAIIYATGTLVTVDINHATIVDNERHNNNTSSTGSMIYFDGTSSRTLNITNSIFYNNSRKTKDFREDIVNKTINYNLADYDIRSLGINNIFNTEYPFDSSYPDYYWLKSSGSAVDSASGLSSEPLDPGLTNTALFPARGTSANDIGYTGTSNADRPFGVFELGPSTCTNGNWINQTQCAVKFIINDYRLSDMDYQIELANNSTFTNSTTLTETNKTTRTWFENLDNLNHGDSYYWRARVKRSDENNWSDWENANDSNIAFMVDTVAPTSTLIRPPNALTTTFTPEQFISEISGNINDPHSGPKNVSLQIKSYFDSRYNYVDWDNLNFTSSPRWTTSNVTINSNTWDLNNAGETILDSIDWGFYAHNYNIVVKLEDNANNISNEIIGDNFIINREPNPVSNFGPASMINGNTWTSISNPSINFDISDPDSIDDGVLIYTIQFDDNSLLDSPDVFTLTNQTFGTKTYNLDLSSKPTGIYYWQVDIKDNYSDFLGPQPTTPNSFKYDANDPEISSIVLSGTLSGTYYRDLVKATINATDVGSGIQKVESVIKTQDNSKCWRSSNNTWITPHDNILCKNTDLSSPYEIDLSSVNFGSQGHNFKIESKAYDNSSRFSSITTKNFQYNRIPSAPTSLGPSNMINGTWNSDSNKTISFDIIDLDTYDNTSNRLFYDYQIATNSNFTNIAYSSSSNANSGNISPVFNMSSFTNYPNTDGLYYWRVRVRDNTETTAWSDWSPSSANDAIFRHDSHAPEISWTTPSIDNQQFLNGVDIIEGNITDNNHGTGSGVGTVKLQIKHGTNNYLNYTTSPGFSWTNTETWLNLIELAGTDPGIFTYSSTTGDWSVNVSSINFSPAYNYEIKINTGDQPPNIVQVGDYRISNTTATVATGNSDIGLSLNENGNIFATNIKITGTNPIWTTGKGAYLKSNIDNIIRNGDIRISTNTGIVGTTYPALGNSIGNIATNLRITGSNTSYETNDKVFVKRDLPNTVQNEDLRIYYNNSSYNTAYVQNGNPDINSAITHTASNLRVSGINDIYNYSNSENVYLKQSQANKVQNGDYRVSGTRGNINPTDSDINTTITYTASNLFITGNNTIFETGEFVYKKNYLADNVQNGDYKIAGSTGIVSTIPDNNTTDIGKTLNTASDLRITGADTTWENGEYVYKKVTLDNKVRTKDYRIIATGYSAGEVVKGNADINTDIITANNLKITGGNATWNSGETIYIKGAGNTGTTLESGDIKVFGNNVANGTALYTATNLKITGGDATWNSGEGIYTKNYQANIVQSGDIRVTKYLTLGQGEVGYNDNDIGLALNSAVATNLRIEGDNTWTSGETLYIKVTNASYGDYVRNGYERVSQDLTNSLPVGKVLAGNQDMGRALYSSVATNLKITGGNTTWDSTEGEGEGEGIYLKVPQNNIVQNGDYRLTSDSALGLSKGVVSAGNSDMGHSLYSSNVSNILITGTNSTWSSAKGAYIKISQDNIVRNGDIRVTNHDGLIGNEIINNSASDIGTTLNANPATNIRITGSNTDFDLGEEAYLKVLQADIVQNGDYRIAKNGLLTEGTVSVGNADLGLAIQYTASNIKITGNDDIFNIGEKAYRKSTNASLNSVASFVRNIFVNYTPTAPYALGTPDTGYSVTNNSLISTNTPRFHFKLSDINTIDTTLKYEIQFLTSINPEIIARTYTSTNSFPQNTFINPVYQIDSSNPLGNMRYYWRVKTIDSNGESSSWSTVYSFIVDNIVPISEITIPPTNNSASNPHSALGIVAGSAYDPGSGAGAEYGSGEISDVRLYIQNSDDPQKYLQYLGDNNFSFQTNPAPSYISISAISNTAFTTVNVPSTDRWNWQIDFGSLGFNFTDFGHNFRIRTQGVDPILHNEPEDNTNYTNVRNATVNTTPEIPYDLGPVNMMNDSWTRSQTPSVEFRVWDQDLYDRQTNRLSYNIIVKNKSNGQTVYSYIAQVANPSNIITRTLGSLGTGSYSWYVVAKDPVLNTAGIWTNPSSEGAFKIDATRPVSTITNPPLSNIDYTSPITISGTASDNGIGLERVEIQIENLDAVTNKYWNNSSNTWVSSQIWNTVTGKENWTFTPNSNINWGNVGHNFTIRSRAVEKEIQGTLGYQTTPNSRTIIVNKTSNIPNIVSPNGIEWVNTKPDLVFTLSDPDIYDNNGRLKYQILLADNNSYNNTYAYSGNDKNSGSNINQNITHTINSGNYYWKIRGGDILNTNWSNYKLANNGGIAFRYDKDAPNTSITYPQTAVSYIGGVNTFSGTFTDTINGFSGIGLTNVKVQLKDTRTNKYLSSTLNWNGNINTWLDLNSIPAGNINQSTGIWSFNTGTVDFSNSHGFLFKYKGIDGLGNTETEDSKLITVNLVPLPATDLAPVGFPAGSATGSRNPTLSFKLHDNNPFETLAYRIEIASGNNFLGGHITEETYLSPINNIQNSNIEYTVGSALTNGSYYFRVTTIDSFGEESNPVKATTGNNIAFIVDSTDPEPVVFYNPTTFYDNNFDGNIKGYASDIGNPGALDRLELSVRDITNNQYLRRNGSSWSWDGTIANSILSINNTDTWHNFTKGVSDISFQIYTGDIWGSQAHSFEFKIKAYDMALPVANSSTLVTRITQINKEPEINNIEILPEDLEIGIWTKNRNPRVRFDVIDLDTIDTNLQYKVRILKSSDESQSYNSNWQNTTSGSTVTHITNANLLSGEYYIEVSVKDYSGNGEIETLGSSSTPSLKVDITNPVLKYILSNK
jgi:predicted outer membrane repeat protein